ncbi:MAG: hypothetical protein V4614_11805 [Pseudomonadota bacterium]
MAGRLNSRDTLRHHGNDSDSEFGGRISTQRARQLNDGDYKFQSHSDREKQQHGREPARLRNSADSWRHAH